MLERREDVGSRDIATHAPGFVLKVVLCRSMVAWMHEQRVWRSEGMAHALSRRRRQALYELLARQKSSEGFGLTSTQRRLDNCIDLTTCLHSS
ncbi:hypothetical protein D3C77_636120 [compost metagenome]